MERSRQNAVESGRRQFDALRNTHYSSQKTRLAPCFDHTLHVLNEQMEGRRNVDSP